MKKNNLQSERRRRTGKNNPCQKRQLLQKKNWKLNKLLYGGAPDPVRVRRSLKT